VRDTSHIAARGAQSGADAEAVGRTRDVAGRKREAGPPLVLEYDQSTGRRLKQYSRAADRAYWTELWMQRRNVSYVRERRGHLPHQLRATFSRWVPRGGRTLEAGCGLGHFTVAADARGYQAHGLDWSAPTIERLRHQFSWIEWSVGDVRRLEFPSHSFDAVYSPGVCEHFEEGPTEVLVETRRVLRRGGIAVISTPCFSAWLQRRAANLTVETVAPGAAFYQYAFTSDGMADLLRRLGFDVVQIHHYGALDTLIRYGGWRVPSGVSHPLAYAADVQPIARRLGSTCIWVARKC
jgi:SAM-dependent methyltransferase